MGEECTGYEWCLPDPGVAPGPERIASPKAVAAPTRLQVAGHHRGFFFSLRMFANREAFYWVHISLQNPSRQFLMKMGRGEREREKEKEWICLEGLKLCTVSVSSGPLSQLLQSYPLGEVNSTQIEEPCLHGNSMERTKWGIKLIFIAHRCWFYVLALFIISGLCWVQEGTSQGCFSSQIYFFIPFLAHPWTVKHR